MRRKRQTLGDVVHDVLRSHQELVLHKIKYFPGEHETWHLDRILKEYTRHTVAAVLDHLRTVEVEERAGMELWEGVE